MMRVQYTVREAVPTDAQAIATVHIASWQAAFRGIVADAWLESQTIEDRTKSWAESLPKPRIEKEIYVALDNRRLAGFAVVGIGRIENYKDRAELYALYNHPDYYGRGAGHVLLAASTAWAAGNGYNRMCVNVLRDNSLGRTFYERTGAVLIPGSEMPCTIGEENYIEVKYEWKDLE